MALLGSAIELTIIGMVVVFLSLIGLMYIIKILNRIFSDKPVQEDASAASGPASDMDEFPLVLAAAAGYFLETERAEMFIPEVRRSGESGWALRARAGSASPRGPR